MNSVIIFFSFLMCVLFFFLRFIFDGAKKEFCIIMQKTFLITLLIYVGVGITCFLE